MNINELVTSLRNKIGQNKLKEAIEELLKFLEDNNVHKYVNTVIQLKRRHHQLTQENIRGIISQGDFTLNLNQITDQLTQCIDDLKEHVTILQSSIDNDSTQHLKYSTAPQLPAEIAEDLYESNNWVQALYLELKNKQGVSVNEKNPMTIFQHYGWLIGEFLRKMRTKVKKSPIRELSCMAEAYQSSLRYLCYIQLAQLLEEQELIQQDPSIQAFFKLDQKALQTFDFADFLIQLTNILEKQTNVLFVPEIVQLTQKLANPKGELYEVNHFLYAYRQQLLNNELQEGEHLQKIVQEYLTALVFWLRQIAFLAQYRLVSIKDIQLNYWAYPKAIQSKKFIHLYADLHEMYKQYGGQNAIEYTERSIENVFTYSQSILLFKGRNLDGCFEKIGALSENDLQNPVYLSLSPLIIDYSVFLDKMTQTPEVYYFAGKEERQYYFADYRNELFGTNKHFPQQQIVKAHKIMKVKSNNIQHPKLNALFEQMSHIFTPTNAALL